MNIAQEILDYTFGLLAIHQPATIDGTYDGTSGTVTMTFVGDPNTYEGEFQYLGTSVNMFREKVIQTAGGLTADHNVFMGIPSRDDFIAEVTE